MALTSGLLLSVAGNYTLWYIVMGFCLVPVLLLGSQKIRIYASLGLVLTFILIMVDYSNGKSHAAQMLKLKLNMRDMHYSKQIDELKEKKLNQYEKHNESLH
jgi:K+ transporter